MNANWDVGQLAECLPSVLKALDLCISISSGTKNNLVAHLGSRGNQFTNSGAPQLHREFPGSPDMSPLQRKSERKEENQKGGGQKVRKEGNRYLSKKYINKSKVS